MAWNVPMVMDLRRGLFAEPLLQPGAHFRRRLMSKGDGGDLLRRHLPPLHQIGDAGHQCAGLARARARPPRR